jgi:hypothetical protein
MESESDLQSNFSPYYTIKRLKPLSTFNDLFSADLSVTTSEPEPELIPSDEVQEPAPRKYLTRKIISKGKYYLDADEEIILITSSEPTIIYLPILIEDNDKLIGLASRLLIRSFSGTPIHRIVARGNNLINDCMNHVDLNPLQTIECYGLGKVWYVVPK